MHFEEGLERVRRALCGRLQGCCAGGAFFAVPTSKARPGAPCLPDTCAQLDQSSLQKASDVANIQAGRHARARSNNRAMRARPAPQKKHAARPSAPCDNVDPSTGLQLAFLTGALARSCSRSGCDRGAARGNTLESARGCVLGAAYPARPSSRTTPRSSSQQKRWRSIELTTHARTHTPCRRS